MLLNEGDAVRVFTEAGRSKPGVVETLRHTIELGTHGVAWTARQGINATIRMIDDSLLSADVRS